jgi:hypothetical protein
MYILFSATSDKKKEDESDASDEPQDLKSMMIARAQEFEQLADMCLHSKKYVLTTVSTITLCTTPARCCQPTILLLGLLRSVRDLKVLC